MRWRPVPGAPEAQERLDGILLSWAGTPYMPGQQARGAGADCIRFVTAVLDEVSHRDPTRYATLPSDAAMHDREGAIAVMRSIKARYEPCESIRDGSIEPGDVLVVGPRYGGPGHAMIVGCQQNVLWHATNPAGIVRTGLAALPPNARVFRVYRMSDRERWS